MAYLDISPTGAAPIPERRGLGARLRAGMRAMQYGQMLRALASLTDDQLRQTGLRREDIPSVAHRAIYGG